MLPGVITSATSSIAQIFAASKLSAAQAAQLAATGKYTPTTGTQPYTYNVAGGIDSSTLMIGAAALLAVVLLSRK